MIDYTIHLEKINEVFLKTSKITIGQQLELGEIFACKIKDAWFNPKVKAGTWDGRIRYYNKNTNLFPIGLLPYFVNFCKKFNYQYKLDFDVSTLNCDISDDDIEQLYINAFKNSFKPRSYQDLAIKKALRNKRGIIEHGTGSGKSLIIYTLIRFLLTTTDKKVLLVVPNINLVNQMFKDFSSYSWTSCESYVSLIYGTSKQKDFTKPIIISTYQSISKKDPNFFKDFGMVLIDECHGGSANSYRLILEKCINAEYRLGFTGSFKDKNDKNERAEFLTITGYLGPLLAQEKTKDLIDNGFLSDINIVNLIIKYPKEIIELTKFDNYTYPQETDIIQNYKSRNKVLDHILKDIDKSHNVLILCNEIEDHLKKVEEYIKEHIKDWKLQIIFGQTKGDKREEIRQDMIQQGGTILLASYGTMSQGCNIPRLHEIIMFSSFRSKTKILQALGRGLRLHESKNKLIAFDIVDDLTYKTIHGGREILHKNYVYDHWIQRLEYYNKQGFKYINKELDLENIINIGM